MTGRPSMFPGSSGSIFAGNCRGTLPQPGGAAMITVLVFIVVGTLALTAAIHLMAARLQQTERMGQSVKRHVDRGNMGAINQTYVYTWQLRDNVTRSAIEGVLQPLLGQIYPNTLTAALTSSALVNLSAYRSDQRAVDPEVSYPFNNLRPSPTADGSVFYERTSAESDATTGESITIFNYLKSYPAPLLGDLLIVHKRATTSGTYNLTGNLRVDGRVVIYEGSAVTGNVRASSCFQALATITNTTSKSDGSGALLPENYPPRPTATAGYGGSSGAFAVTNGTLKMINNTDFTPGSVRHIMESGGTSTWMTCSTSNRSSTNIETDRSRTYLNSAVEVDVENNPAYAFPTTSPYNVSKSGTKVEILKVRLKNTGLKHLKIVSGVEQLVIEGQTSISDYNNAAGLDPVIIWVEQNTLRDIRFVGENSRPLILALGPGNGATVHLGFHGGSLAAGSPLRWRMQLINEYRAVYLDPPSSSLSVLITGGIRTNWSINSTYTDSVVRYILQPETEPGELELMLPRDGWLEPYVLVR